MDGLNHLKDQVRELRAREGEGLAAREDNKGGRLVHPVLG